MITHGTPAAPDAGPNLLKISESAFCGGLRAAARDRPAASSPRTARREGVVHCLAEFATTDLGLRKLFRSKAGSRGPAQRLAQMGDGLLPKIR